MASEFWFKFRFKDWGNDTRPLSSVSKGILIELIIHLRTVNGEMPYDIRLTEKITGGLTEEIEFAFAEFRKYNIFDFVIKGGKEYVISRGIKKEFHKSFIAKDNGSKGGNPILKLNKRNNKSRLTKLDKQEDNQPSYSVSNSYSESISEDRGVGKGDTPSDPYGFSSDQEKFYKALDNWKEIYKTGEHRQSLERPFSIALTDLAQTEAITGTDNTEIRKKTFALLALRTRAYLKHRKDTEFSKKRAGNWLRDREYLTDWVKENTQNSDTKPYNPNMA
jgi:hypothetical protein